MSIGTPRGRRWLSCALSVAVASIASCTETPAPEPRPTEPAPASASPTLTASTSAELPVDLRPYPFSRQTPPPEPTEIDGTYMIVRSLGDLGGVESVPLNCFRCLPYDRDPGVTTMILFEGIYFVHHHMSGFRARGSFEIDGRRLLLFNDANCSSTTGVYTWRIRGDVLSLEVIDDPCAFEGERARDLATDRWVRIPVCGRQIQQLWPGILGC